MVAFWEKRAFGELSREVDALSKVGEVFLLSEFITINQSATVGLALNTNGATVRLLAYELISSDAAVKGSFIEDPTFTDSASSVVGRNLHRGFSDTTTVTFENAASITGGTTIATELVGTEAKSGGALSTQRIHTLLPDTSYVMKFENIGNQNTTLHINLLWSEGEPTPPPIWP